MAENQELEFDLDAQAVQDADRNVMFRTHFLEHIERGHSTRLKEGIRHFLRVYKHFTGPEDAQLEEIRDNIASRFEDINEDLRQITQNMMSIEHRLKRKILPRHVEKTLKARVKVYKKAIRWNLKLYWLNVKQYAIINAYVVDCRFLTFVYETFNYFQVTNFVKLFCSNRNQPAVLD